MLSEKQVSGTNGKTRLRLTRGGRSGGGGQRLLDDREPGDAERVARLAADAALLRPRRQDGADVLRRKRLALLRRALGAGGAVVQQRRGAVLQQLGDALGVSLGVRRPTGCAEAEDRFVQACDGGWFGVVGRLSENRSWFLCHVC